MSNDPYAQLAPVPTITVTSTFAEGDVLPLAQVAPSHGGEGRSPALEWSPVAGAAAYLVTCYDPDAPTMSGFWHWVVKNVPGDVTSLPADAGSGEAGALPDGAEAGSNEFLSAEYLGAAPPAGHGPHRYFFTVSALSAPVEAPDGATAAVVHFMARDSVIARGHLMGTWENTGD